MEDQWDETDGGKFKYLEERLPAPPIPQQILCQAIII
jgi:hypothetical protein